MYTFIDNQALHALAVRFYESAKVVAIVCHATCILLKAKTADGKLLVEGKTFTDRFCGTASKKEAFADSFVGQKNCHRSGLKLKLKKFLTRTLLRAERLRRSPCGTGV